MELMTKELSDSFPPLYSQDGCGDATVLFAKYFTTDSKCTWFVAEYDPEQRLFFGLVIGHDVELGYFSLDDLETVRGGLGLPVERDLYFVPTTVGKVRNR